MQYKKNLSGLYKYYYLIFLLCNLFSTCIFTKKIYSICIPVVLILGGIVFLYSVIVLRKKAVIPDVKTYIHICFIGIYAIVIVLQSSNYLKDFAQLLSCIIYFFVIYMGIAMTDSKEREEILSISAIIIFVFGFLLAIASNVLLLFSINGKIIVFGEEYLFGIVPRSEGYQLWGVSGSPVTFCVLLFFSLLSSMRIIKEQKHIFIRTIIVIVDIFIWIALSATNANYFVLLILAFALCLLLFCFITEVRSGLRGQIKKAALILLFFACVLFSYKLTQRAISGMQQYVSKAMTEGNIEYFFDRFSHDFHVAFDIEEEIDIQRSFSSTRLDVRTEIWRNAFMIFKKHPLGVSNSNAKVNVYYGEPDHEFTNLHNGYIQVLVAGGIQAAVLIFAFLIIQFLQVIKKSFQEKDIVLVIMTALCFAILCGELVNGCFVFDRGVTYSVLWGALGFLNNKSRQNYTVSECIEPR